eukprot:14283201-Ditylum_brightwellii.AAC.1
MVKAVENKDFNNIDANWDTCHDRLPAGSVNCSHIFTVEKSETTALKMQDYNESVLCLKDLMKVTISN